MVCVELLNAPDQGRVRFLAHDDLAERIGGDKHGIGAGVNGPWLHAFADLKRTIKALDDWACGNRRRIG